MDCTLIHRPRTATTTIVDGGRTRTVAEPDGIAGVCAAVVLYSAAGYRVTVRVSR
jgi:hypothetical protein